MSAAFSLGLCSADRWWELETRRGCFCALGPSAPRRPFQLDVTGGTCTPPRLLVGQRAPGSRQDSLTVCTASGTCSPPFSVPGADNAAEAGAQASDPHLATAGRAIGRKDLGARPVALSTRPRGLGAERNMLLSVYAGITLGLSEGSRKL